MLLLFSAGTPAATSAATSVATAAATATVSHLACLFKALLVRTSTMSVFLPTPPNSLLQVLLDAWKRPLRYISTLDSKFSYRESIDGMESKNFYWFSRPYSPTPCCNFHSKSMRISTSQLTYNPFHAISPASSLSGSAEIGRLFIHTQLYSPVSSYLLINSYVSRSCIIPP